MTSHKHKLVDVPHFYDYEEAIRFAAAHGIFIGREDLDSPYGEVWMTSYIANRSAREYLFREINGFWPMKHGDPRKTRMKVHWDGTRWRVFELVQPGQDISTHGDYMFRDWDSAIDSATMSASKDRMYAYLYGEDRNKWPK